MTPDRLKERAGRIDFEPVGMPGAFNPSDTAVRERGRTDAPAARGTTLPANRTAHRMLVALIVGIDLAVAAAGTGFVAPLRFDTDRLLTAFSAANAMALLFLGGFVWLAMLSARGAYRPRILVAQSEQIARILSAAVPAWVAVHLLAIWLKVTIPFESRLVMGVSLPATIALFIAARLLIVRPLATLVHRRLALGPVLFIGDGDRAIEMTLDFGAMDRRRRRVAHHALSAFGPGRAASVVREQEFGEVFVMPERGQTGEALEIAFATLDAGADVRLIAPEFSLLKGVPQPGIDGLPILRLRRLDFGGPEAFFKRLIDIVGALVGLAVLSPFLALVALAVKLSSPGPVIFKQDRVGRGGTLFPMYKFRTMGDGNDSSDYEAYSKTFIREGRAAYVAEDGSKIYKPPADPRVTRVGAILRKFSIDELPQLWNVLLGDMSLVGPRPCMIHEWELYEPWQRRRLDALPGCTGLWQVRGRSRVRFDEMVILDLYYAHRGTLLTDLALMIQTVPVMVLGRGAY